MADIVRKTANLFDGTLETGYFYNTDFDLTATDNPVFKSLKVYLPAGTYTLKWSVPVRAVREVNNGVLIQNPFENSNTWVFQVNSDGYFGISFRNMTSTQWDSSVTITLDGWQHSLKKFDGAAWQNSTIHEF